MACSNCPSATSSVAPQAPRRRSPPKVLTIPVSCTSEEIQVRLLYPGKTIRKTVRGPGDVLLVVSLT